MANNIRIGAQVTGASKAASELDQLKDKFTKLQNTTAKGFVTGVGAGIGLSAFNAVKNGLEGLAGEAVHAAGEIASASLRAYTAQEDSLAKLNASLQANTTLLGDTTAIEKRIKANEALGFTDTDLRNSLSLLVAATHDVDKAFAVQSVAMDLARFRHLSLEEATTALTTIEGGRARGLAQLGINVKDYATIEERLAAVEKVAQGQADSYSKTLTGELAVGMAKVNDSGEKLGHTLGDVQAKVMPPLLDSVTGLIDKFGSLIPGFKDGRDAALDVAFSARNLANQQEHLGSETDAASRAAQHNAAVLKDWGAGLGTLNHDFQDLAASISSAASTLENDLFGKAIEAGRKADLKTQLADLNKQLKGTTGNKRQGLLGQIASVQQALFDLNLQEAQAAGPAALIRFLDDEKKHTKDLTKAERDLIDAMEEVARKQAILRQITTAGVEFTGVNPGGTHRAPGTLPPVPAVPHFGTPTKPGRVDVYVHVDGHLTNSQMYTLTQRLGPYLARYLQSHNIVPRQASGAGLLA